jgi:hypothetical protein
VTPVEDFFDAPRVSRAGEESGGPAGEQAERQEFQCVDFCPICRTADVLRAALPDEFQEHWHALQREGLLAARTLLDHYIAHIESARPRPVDVEDIPIE